MTLESASDFIANIKQLLTKKAYAGFKAMLRKTTISEIYYYFILFLVLHDHLEIIRICLFGAQVTFIIINVDNCYDA